MATSRQQRGEATRAGILSVARRLFSDFGYHNTGIADIQAATGLTKGAFYHHFRAKQDLALGVLELVENDYREQFVGPALAEATPGRRVAALLDAAVTLNDRPEWSNCRLLATLSAEVTAADGALADAVRSVQERMLDTLEQLIADAKQSGEVGDIDPAVGAQMIQSTLMGLMLARKLGITRVQSGDVVALLKRSLLGGDASEPPVSEAKSGDGLPSEDMREREESEYF
jgi:AcrR family transcriptional regulator